MLNTIKSVLQAYFGGGASGEQVEAVKGLVETIISSNKVAVFSKSYCPYCTRAKAILSGLGQDSNTKTIELDHEAGSKGPAIQAYLAQRAGASRVTVPQIYINQKLVGGCSDLQQLQSSGELSKLLG